MRCHARDKHLIAAERECGPRVGGDVYHRLFSKRRNRCFVLIKLTLHFFVCHQVAILLQGPKHVEIILHHSWLGQLASSVATVAMPWYLAVFTAGSATFTL